MKLLGFSLIAAIILSSGLVGARPKLDLTRGRNGGSSCMVCTALIVIVEQLVEINNSTVVKTVDGLCHILPKSVHFPCKEALEYLGPSLVKLIVHKNGPDVVCHALNFCNTDPGAEVCRSITPPLETSELPFELKVAKAKSLIASDLGKFPKGVDICDIPGISFICNWLNRSISDRTPLIDFDKDGFSPSMTYRGTAWRGKDCSDLFNSVHPGAKPLDTDRSYDSNCNGISGVNKETKRPFEEELCGQSQPKGVATLGDSISAHFSFPPNWIDATKISKEAFKPLALVIEDESDWPMLGSFTGHGTNNWTEVIQGPIDSIYNRMVERNRCNHRDYQNIAINGEDSFNVHDVMKTLSRDQELDRPLLLFIVLVGNDVCQGKTQNLDDMTTPKQMHHNTLITLDYLEKRLPKGSSVMILGLADGRPLYETMSKRTHPVATYWGDFTYSQFYDYLNCMEISPCPAWLNSNDTARERAAKRVEELNLTLKKLAEKRKDHYSNFNLYYLEDPLVEVLRDWEEQGREVWELVEPSDGFHSNQLGQALTAKAIWKEIETKYPEALGPINPNNDLIQKLFGDQGGL